LQDDGNTGLKKTPIYTKIGIMEMNVNYLTDSKGNKIAVQVPFPQWSRLLEDYNRLKQYTKLKTNLKISFNEIEEIESGNKETTTLSEFLDEC
jgi:DNA-binding Xre family transcriptional regulator